MNASPSYDVSVIVPAFNRILYIARTIDSVLAQTLRSVELIVVDDGSTDGTYELLQSYAGDGKLQLFIHESHRNRGQSASINLGLERATGRYISILDSDDLFAPQKLQHMVEYLDKNYQVGLVYSNGYAIDAAGRILYKMLPAGHSENNDPNRILLDCFFLLPQNAVVRKEVFDRAGRFEESFRSAQDHDMLLRIVEIARIAYLPEYLFYYRRHGDSISGKHQDVRWRTGFEILRRARRRYPYSKSTIRKRRAVLHFRMGQVHWRRGKKVMALPRFAASALLDPSRAARVALGRERVR